MGVLGVVLLVVHERSEADLPESAVTDQRPLVSLAKKPVVIPAKGGKGKVISHDNLTFRVSKMVQQAMKDGERIGHAETKQAAHNAVSRAKLGYMALRKQMAEEEQRRTERLRQAAIDAKKLMLKRRAQQAKSRMLAAKAAAKKRKEKLAAAAKASKMVSKSTKKQVSDSDRLVHSIVEMTDSFDKSLTYAEHHHGMNKREVRAMRHAKAAESV